MTFEQELILRCAYCGFDTRLVVKVAQQAATSGKKISVVRYCEQCNRPNRLEVDENVDVHAFILGRDKGFLGYRQDIPILQGEKEI
jgi:hypothetical protein